MLYWMKPLPEVEIDLQEYKPVVENEWFREHFMKFVYALQVLLIFVIHALGIWDFASLLIEIPMAFAIFAIHECCHFSVIWNQGDVSLIHSGIFFWMNSDAKMSKWRFFLFMSLPLWVLTVLPAILTFFTAGDLVLYLRFIAWTNAVIAGSDLINVFVILAKPNKSVFYRGFYKVNK